MSKKHKAGVVVLIIGCVMLLTGIIAAFALGTVLVPALIFTSILLNSAGITLLRSRS